MRAVMMLLLVALPLTGCADDIPAAEIEVPADSLVIPRFDDAPVLDNQVGHAEWEPGLRLDGEFVIANGSPSDGTYPFNLRIGADDRNFYMLIQLDNMTRNPYSSPPDHERVPDGKGEWHADAVAWMTTRAGATDLNRPSDRKYFQHLWEMGTAWDNEYWNGLSWVVQPGKPWGYSFNDGRPEGGLWARGTAADNQTIFWEIYMPRESPWPEYDGLQARGPTVFKAALMFTRHGSESIDPVDVFPGDGYTPDGETDPSGWLTFYVPF